MAWEGYESAADHRVEMAILFKSVGMQREANGDVRPVATRNRPRATKGNCECI